MAPEPAAAIGARRYAGMGTAALSVGALAYIGLVDPHRPGSPFPPCPFRALTGWYCPACGGLRMTHDLLHGDLPAAVVDNAFLLAGLPLLAIWFLWRRRRRRSVFTPKVVTVIVVAALAWTIIRNIDGFPLLPTLLGS